MEKGGYVYMLTNKNNRVIYIGVTANLVARINEHKLRVYPTSFTAKYNCDKIVYFEVFENIEDAIVREKQLKAGSRETKIKLISGMNASWKDLFDEIQELD